MFGQNQFLSSKITLKDVWNSPCLPQTRNFVPHWKLKMNKHKANKTFIYFWYHIGKLFYPNNIFLHISTIAQSWRAILTRDMVGESALTWYMIALNPTDSLDSIVLFVTMFEADPADVTQAFGWHLVNLSRQTTCSNGWLTKSFVRPENLLKFVCSMLVSEN